MSQAVTTKDTQSPPGEGDPATAGQTAAAIDGMAVADAVRHALAPMSGRNAGAAEALVALDRIRAVQGRYPQAVRAFIAEISLLRRIGQLDAALDVAIQLRSRFRRHQGLLLAEVRVLNDQGRHDEALARLFEERGSAGPSASLDEACSQTLCRLGRLEEAEAMIGDALAASPDNAVLLQEHASLANRRGDWVQALARWTRAATALPGNRAIQTALIGARQQADGHEFVAAGLADGQAERFARFESLGGTHAGCEFGLVQRHAGSTLLGLFRWSNLAADKLLDGLQTRFAGIGGAETTSLVAYPRPGNRQEYVVVDSHYGLWSHTFIAVEDAPHDKLLVQTVRRLGFLRDKLVEDLQQAAKIFVYKFDSRPADGVIEAIFRAARAYGDVHLLCVCKADRANPPGSVRTVSDGLYVGYLRHFMKDAGSIESFDLAGWREVCERVLEIVA